MERLNYSEIFDKKSPIYYLKLEAQQEKSLLNEKNINKFVDEATRNINIAERSAMYSILKYVILNNGYKKMNIINKISQMYKNEKIEPIINASQLNRQTLQKFKNLDEDTRKKLIIELVNSLNKMNFDNLKDDENQPIELDENIVNTIENQEYIYIEYNDKNKRLLYVYEDGTVIAINIKNNQCTSKIKKVEKENVKYLKQFLKNDMFDLRNDNETIIIDIDGKDILKNKYIFYIILLLLKEKSKIQDRNFFDYEYYFNFTFRSEVRMLHKEQREALFIFEDWCPEQESQEIVEVCKNITSNITVDLNNKDVMELYYFANYYKQNKNYAKAIQCFEKIAEDGIDYANGEIAYLYNLMSNSLKEKEYLNKVNDFITIYKDLTAKKCYEIVISENSGEPNITDSKMYGDPYLPIGEEYPISKEGKLLKLLIQINFKDVKLDGYPEDGVLQVYIENNSTKPESQIRYYKDLSLPYQTELPETEELKSWKFEPTNTKINLRESTTYMPLIDNGIESAIKRTIKKYNKSIGINLLKYDVDDADIWWYLIENKVEIFPKLLGGYADYYNTDFYTSRKKESLLKLMSNFKTGDNYSVNVLISKKELKNREFNKAEIIFE